MDTTNVSPKLTAPRRVPQYHMSKTHYAAVLPDGTETFYDVQEGDRLRTIHNEDRDAAIAAMHKANLTTPRKHPVEVAVKIFRLDVVEGQVKRVFIRTIRVTPPLARLTKEEFEAEMADATSDLPDDFRGFVSNQAWDRGHSAGYEEVVMIAQELADSLLPAINKHTQTLLPAINKYTQALKGK